MVAIIDYGAGNLFSVKNTLDYLGFENIITKNQEDLINATHLILPGVGAFPMAMEMLIQSNLVDCIKEQVKTKPLLGICLGMQFLFDSSNEFGTTQGLGFIEGNIDKIQTDLKIPHMGYNELEFNNKSPLLNNINEGDCVYFVHSYMAYTKTENVIAYSDYSCHNGDRISAMVQKGNVYGCQFHPEKSGNVGLQIIKNFCEL